MKSALKLCLGIIFCLILHSAHSQCNPPAANSCDSANVLCSLDDVNGYTCKNTEISNSAGCRPLCPGGGIPNNTSWWGFVTNGGNICITIEFSNCSITGTGVQMGVYGDCSCMDTIACFSDCQGPGQYQICGNLEACKTYYLFVDGCSGDVCDFTLKTSGGTTPRLKPLIDLQGPTAICAGACNVKYKILQDSSKCIPFYTWTLDGVVIKKDSSHEQILDFPNQGDFVLCVSAVIGNSNSISVCDMVGPLCKTVRVTQAPVRTDTRYLCPETIPYNWHGLTVDTTGDYTQRFIENCCGIDSVVHFIIVPRPTKPDIFYLGCKGDKYVDSITKQSFNSCQNGAEIFLSKSTTDHQCDSSYFLYATFLDLSSTLNEYCSGGKIFLESKVTDNTCKVNGYSTKNIAYNWYEKSDPNKTSIGNTNTIEILKTTNYCVDVEIIGNLNGQDKTCLFTFCENINEDQFKQNMVCPKGDLQLCKGESGTYTTDTIFPSNVKHIWTVSNGTILTTNPVNNSTIDIKWDFDPGAGIPFVGKICYHYESDCPPSPECCIEVNLQPYPTPKAGPDKSTCGLTNTIDGVFNAGGGTWVQISGPNASISPNNIANPTITASTYGTCGFVISENRLGCIGSDTVFLSFFEVPVKGPTTYICEPDQQSYTLKFVITKGAVPYKVIKGNGTIDVNNTYISGLLPNILNDTIIIEDVNGCSFTYIQSHECQCSNEIGIISNTLQEACESDFIKLIYDATTEKLDQAPNRDTVVFFVYSNASDPIGSILFYLTGSTVLYNPVFTYGTIYYIGARLGRADGKGNIDLSKGCLKSTFGTPFKFYQNPSPNAGNDTSLCSSSYTLRGFQSVTGSTINWREQNNKAVSFNNANAAVTNVDIRGGYGSYTFIIKEDNHNGLCVAEDPITVLFNPDPEIKNLDPQCVELGTGMSNVGRFIVSADIQNGKPPYMLLIPPSTLNGKINVNKWNSDTLMSLDNYTIQIKDANGCVSSIISDSYNCNCGPINAGILDTLINRACWDTCIAIKDLVAETINPAEDVVMYVLHNGSYNNPASVIDTFFSKNDKICFDPKTMKLGSNNPIYLTRVVGDDQNPKDGIVDNSDRCKRASNNMTIVFEDYPKPNAGTNKIVCGLQTNLDGILSFGNANWILISSPPGSNIIFEDVTKLNTNVDVNIFGTYNFVLSGKNYTCIGYDTVSIRFVGAPNFIRPSVQFVCDSVAENYKVIVTAQQGDRPSWTVGSKYDNSSKNLQGAFQFNSNIWESNWIPNGVNFSLNIRDINNCNIDNLDSIHTCNCLTKIGVLDTTPMLLCIDQSSNAKYNSNNGFLDPNDVFQFVLYDGLQNDPRNGLILQTNNSGIFSFNPSTMVPGKTYFIAVFAGNKNANNSVNFNDRCLVFTNGVPVTWYKYPEAKIVGPNLLTCTVTSLNLDASGSISGSGFPLKYKWSNSDTSATTTVVLNGTFTVTVTDTKSQCTQAASIVVNRMVDLPKVIVDTPLKITCSRLQVDINGNKSDQGGTFSAFWKGNGIVSGANNYLTTVNKPGLYTIVVENKLTNCRDSVDVIVGIDTTPPHAKITQVGTLGCVVKEISLNGNASMGSSGTIDAYLWNGLGVNGQTGNSVKVQSPGGVYQLRVRDSKNGCFAYDTIQILEEGNPLGEIQLGLLNPKCNGDNSGNISVTKVLDKNGLELTDLEYSINGSAFTKNPDFGKLPQGSYTITVRNRDGCLLTKTELIKAPEALNIVGKSIVVDQGTIVDIDSLLLSISGGTVSVFGDYQDTLWYSVYDSNYLSNLVYVADTTKEFRITVIDQNGCQTSTIVKVVVRILKEVWWPTAFNPNSSLSENAFFNLYGKRVRNIKILNIFSRWGELVYSAENFQDANKVKGLGWNGIFRGQKALPGVYTFYAEVEFENSTSSDKVKGEFTLIR